MKALLAALVLAVAGTHGTTAQRTASTSPSVVGGSAAQRVLLRRILRRADRSGIAQVRIQRATGAVRLVFEPTAVPANTQTRVRWSQDLVAASFFVRSIERGLPRVAGYRAAGGGRSFSTLPRHDEGPLDRRALRVSLASALSAPGVRVRELSFFRPRGPAVAIVVQAAAAVDFAARRLGRVIRALDSFGDELDGYYFEVTSQDRQTLFAYGVAGAAGSFSVTVANQLARCAARLHLRVAISSHGVPPCPPRGE